MDEETLISLGLAASIGIVFIVISITSLDLYAKRKSRLLLFFFVAWSLYGLQAIIEAISYALASSMLYRVSSAILAPASLVAWIVFLDYAEHDEIRVGKMAIAIFVGAVYATWVLHPDNVMIYDGIEFKTGNDVRDFIYIMLFSCMVSVNVVTYARWSIITYMKAPGSIKKPAMLLLFGSICAILSLTATWLEPFVRLAGEIDIADLLVIASVIGLLVLAIITAMAIRREPKLAHLLPYTVYALFIGAKTGEPLCQKNWTKHGLEPIMILGLLSAFNDFAKNTMKGSKMDDHESSGTPTVLIESKDGQKIDILGYDKEKTISEIRMEGDSGIILTNMKYSEVNVALVASRASTALKESLEKFTIAFLRKFKEFFYKDGAGLIRKRLNAMEAAETFTRENFEPLIESHFPDVPSFIELTADDIMQMAEEETTRKRAKEGLAEIANDVHAGMQERKNNK